MTHKKGSTCKVEPYLCLPYVIVLPIVLLSFSPLLVYFSPSLLVRLSP